MAHLRVDLAGSLSGHHIVIDPDELTLGAIEDMSSGSVALMMTSLAAMIVGGDLPKGTDRAGLRQLTLQQAKEVFDGIQALPVIPKS